MQPQTPGQRLASLLLGQPVIPWIRSRRTHMSWRQIAAELRDKTDGQVDVTAQTLVNWTTADPAPERRGEVAS